MIRSLRLRFFLITWPLIVVAVAGVAFAFDRWTQLQLTTQRLEGPDPARARILQPADNLARAWSEGVTSDSGFAAAIRELAQRDSAILVVVDPRGVILASSDPGIRLAEPTGSLPRSGPVEFRRTITRGQVVTEEMVAVTGRPILDRSGTVRAALFVLPSSERPPLPGAARLRADARRTVWIVVVVASAVAAVLAILLAGPLVGQVTRLAQAASRVRGGDFAARVSGGGPDELGRMESAFNEMAATLQRAEIHKRNLVHDVAHELRTPLTNVIGILEAIEDGLRQPDDATLATLRTEAGLLTALVNDLQDLSLAESGQLGFEVTAVDLVTEAAAAIESIRSSAGAVILEAPHQAPVFASADRRRLGQVLRNLLRNAVTHTPAGGRVTIAVREAGREAGLLVSDTGTGIPAAHLDLIWERFHRVDPARDRAGGGRGLGLAIVKQFVEGMGGRVAVSSLEGRGSTFEVWLPRAGKGLPK